MLIKIDLITLKRKFPLFFGCIPLSLRASYGLDYAVFKKKYDQPSSSCHEF
jgi:hypothetical protein